MGSQSTSTLGPTSEPAAVLTTSVLPSPVVRSVLHAKIRSASFNDVVFVGDHVIQVKHVKDEGHLDHVIAKSDFDATIRAAKVLTIRADEIHRAESFIKREDEASSSGAAAHVPPQCLVLTLDSNDILFLYLATADDSRPHFICQTFPMPVFDRTLFQPGHHLAVDHRSRAFAVAAQESEVVVYAAKSSAHIQHELQLGDPDWCPVSAQRPIQVGGAILQMEFLIPPHDDEDHVVLLVIVAQNRQIKAIRIDWHHALDIHHAQIHEPLPLDQLANAPGLLVPLRNAAFLLANGCDIKCFSDILSGSIRCRELPIASIKPLYPGESPMQPIWTNWCRPERGSGAADQLYLAREDGNVFYVWETSAMGPSYASCNAGDMECHIGSAFASVGDLDGPDTLITAGDMSTGCVKEIGSRFAPGGHPERSRPDAMGMKFVESIPNWASVTDMITSTLPGKTQRAREGILVTSGRQPFGAVTELRRGLEVKLAVFFPLEGLGNVQTVWTVPVVGIGHVLLILSGPSGTSFLQLEGDAEDEGEDLSTVEPAGLDPHHATLFAAFVDSKIVQVTSRTISVTAGVNAGFEDRARIDKQATDPILCATCDPHLGRLITAERHASSNALEVYNIGTEHESDQADIKLEPTTSLRLPCEPLALACTNANLRSVVVVASDRGDLDVFAIGRDDECHDVGHTKLPDSEEGTSMCDSIVILDAPEAECDRRLIVCGLRDGRIFTVQATFQEKKIVFTGETVVHFGQSSVRVCSTLEETTHAHAMSGLETCRLSWRPSRGSALDIVNVYLTDKHQPAFAQGSMSSCAHTPPAHLLSSASQTFADSIIFVSAEDIFIGKLSRQAEAVPRRIEIDGTPTRLLYLERQRYIASASLRYDVRSFSTAPCTRRQIWPAIDFIPTKSNALTMSYEMQPGERVYALLEWAFEQDDGKVYSFLLVGGSYISAKSRTTKGRITFLQPTNRSWEIVEVKESRQERFDKPVTALALLDSLTFVVCYGFMVAIHRFNKDERRWHPICAPFELHSAGTNIIVENAAGAAGSSPLITIATNTDSSTVLRLDTSSSTGHAYDYELVVHCTAPKAASTLHHLTIGSTTLATTKNGKLIGLQRPPHGSPTDSSRLLFEASLPRSLTRVQRGAIRAPWKPAPPPGVLASDILGCSADGTLTGVMLLDDHLWRRLSWAQRLCEWSAALSPHSHLAPVYSVGGEETLAREERGMPVGLHGGAAARGDEIVLRTQRRWAEQDRHVDGDVLARILEHGGAECLRGLVREAAQRQDAVGEWVRKHLDAELAAVEEVMGIVEAVVDGWL